MPSSKTTAAGALAVLALINIIWGAMFPFIKPALEVVPPFTFALLRFIVATAVFVPIAGREAIALLRGPDGRRLAVMGVLGMCITQVSQALALKLSTASDIALLIATSPLWIALLARLWLGEHMSRRAILGFGCAMLGIGLVLWPRGAADIGPQRIIGDLLCIITTVAWAGYNVMGKEIMARRSPVAATAACVFVGTPCIIPFAAYELLTGQTPRLTLAAGAGILYAGLLVTALGFVVLFWTLARVRANQAAVLMYLQPVAGVLIAWAMLGERLAPLFFAGVVPVFAGVALVTGQRQQT
jgi:drug/metabolite transporter (DMT)-like permease